MCRVIAEVGLNHGGEIEVAKQLIKQAKDAGCWGIKFQYRNVETFYKNKNEVGDTIIFEENKKNYISLDDILILINYCKDLKINFGISLFRSDDLKELKKISSLIDFFKVPSAECLNTALISDLKKQNKRIFVSTGGHQTSEVIKHLEKFKNDITIFHCISNYPTLLGTEDLRAIVNYTKNGFSEVGYSSHDDDWEVCLLALSEGAKWIERHITLKKDANGLDHSSSSVFGEFKKLVKFCDQYQNILGDFDHLPNQGERINLQNLGTSLYAKYDLTTNKTSALEDFEVRAPRVGISPGEFMREYENKKVLKPLKKGEALSTLNYSKTNNKIREEVKDFAKDALIGLPVRLHDYYSVRSKFGVGNYEFHLSFSEVLSGDLNKILNDMSSEENFSIHLPDYIPGNHLLDPISRDNNIKEVSRQVIDKVNIFSNAIENKIGKKVNIVGSFSKTHNQDRITNLNEIFEYLISSNVNILPQWLPVHAWYFGGIVQLNLFNSSEDISFIKKNNLSICLDFSHLVMAASFYNESWKSWYKELKPCAEHIHISDASDSKSEGLMFGDGIIGDFSEILQIQKMKIIECWQGHINEGEGFKESLEILYKQFNTSEQFNARK